MNIPNPQNRLFRQTTTSLTLLLIFSLNVSASNKHCQKATAYKHTELPKNNTCTPKLKADHYSIFCLDYANHNLKQPVFDSECSPSITDLSYSDEYIDLNCSMEGFENYFSPSQWTISKINGDGGVDVTGAPNITLVEGANKALVEIASGSTTNLKIVVPANGIATFDWSNFGGSKFFYSLLLNGKAHYFAKGEVQKGAFRTPVMRVGDVLEFQLKASETDSRLEISNFHFYSNATALVKRHWIAKDEYGETAKTTQLISIEKANITDVIFPANRDDIEAPSLSDNTDYTPRNTGFPFIDRDGDLSTTNDQYQLEEGSCTFNIDWTDEWNTDGIQYNLERRWIITDWCNNSVLEGTQFIKLNNLPTPEVFPGLHPDQKAASNQNYEQLSEPFTGLNKRTNPGGYGTAFRCKTKFYSLTQVFPSLWDKLAVAATIENEWSD